MILLQEGQCCLGLPDFQTLVLVICDGVGCRRLRSWCLPWSLWAHGPTAVHNSVLILHSLHDVNTVSLKGCEGARFMAKCRTVG